MTDNSYQRERPVLNGITELPRATRRRAPLTARLVGMLTAVVGLLSSATAHAADPTDPAAYFEVGEVSLPTTVTDKPGKGWVAVKNLSGMSSPVPLTAARQRWGAIGAARDWRAPAGLSIQVSPGETGPRQREPKYGWLKPSVRI